MSKIQGKVGPWELSFLSPPRGMSGTVQVLVQGRVDPIEVRWARDEDGLWIETPEGVYGFDLDGQNDEESGPSFRIAQRNSGKVWQGQSFARAGEARINAVAGTTKKGVRIRAQMPGKIVHVLVEEGASVERDQPLLVMEAMKMENEIRAPQAGVVKGVRVKEGQAVETGADLVVLE